MITGANSGLGRAAATDLAKMGASIVMVCRNEQKGREAQSKIKEESGNNLVDLLIADLSSLVSIRKLAVEFQQKYSKLDVLVNNAGLFNLRRHLSEDGFEMTFAVNYLAPFLLTNLLLEKLKASAPSRVVNVSSVAHYSGHINFDDLQGENGYSGFRAYSQSKLALILFTRELAIPVSSFGVTSNSLHPGAVATNIWSRAAGPAGFIMKLPTLFMTSAKKGAETIVYLASSPDVENVSGEYFEKKVSKKSAEESYDNGIAAKLWDVSARLVRL